MNGTVNKYSLAGDKCMLQMHLKQPGFTYNAFRPFAKTKKEEKNLKKKEIQDIFVKTSWIKLVLTLHGLGLHRF